MGKADRGQEAGQGVVPEHQVAAPHCGQGLRVCSGAATHHLPWVGASLWDSVLA